MVENLQMVWLVGGPLDGKQIQIHPCLGWYVTDNAVYKRDEENELRFVYRTPVKD